MNNIETELQRQKQLLKMFPLQYLNIEKQIDCKRKDWRYRYYELCLNCSYNNNNKDYIVYQYLQSIVWTFHYYFNNNISWEWFYQFQYAPTCKDIFNCLENNVVHGKIRKNKCFNVNNVKKTFQLGKPLKQQELLIMVLPLENKSIMINNINLVLEKTPLIKSYFPSNII